MRSPTPPTGITTTLAEMHRYHRQLHRRNPVPLAWQLRRRLRCLALLVVALLVELFASRFGCAGHVSPMALVLLEGFDHITASQLTTKSWTANVSSMQPGRFGGQAARLLTGSGSSKTLPSTYSTLIVGFALRISVIPGTTQDVVVIKAGATSTCRIGVNSSGLIVVRNSAGTTIATGTTALIAGNWYYVEAKLVVGTSGTIEVHLNGVSEIASTTGNFGTTNVDTFNFVPIGSGTTDWDDIYALDTTGAAPRNTFLGDVRIATVYPTADGAHSQWTPDSGSSHFARVDEAQADGDTSYVSDSTPGDIDTYTFGDVDGGATVYGLQTNLYARKDDANTRQIAPVIRQAGSDNVGATVTLGSSYATFSQLYNQDPTGSDWTASNVNADEFGVKEIA